jgi:hypothetical protein
MRSDSMRRPADVYRNDSLYRRDQTQSVSDWKLKVVAQGKRGLINLLR